ncbi:MAG: branched-chain amino acid transaminase [Caldilinea sp.]|jgi:branched-chain amino acid aminotransferase|uniref:Branched-chain-amino-acid aminotransferase n=2 Tax=Caldilinea aerophila TaxID=133453 RepID=I0I1Q8_CALAS|nr:MULTISPECIES: branched-chain amino acid transaminase [Caldilinea]MBO9394314.1 branched-chain amino acid transaminase [Caldilinea sp.]BAL99195.1 branched-chain amino acid aminotransferase [Caldilinea aerophila DSM 14535 = NBRC 104270]GIV74212.1 MAG: branched-chain amino acid aminotransferase [Caldilinea sp.]
MAMRADYIWMNGQIIPWDEAKVHVFAHALHYGSSVFEGIRVYETTKGPAIFRGREHYERLLYSAKVARIPSPYTVDDYMQATKDVVRANKQRSAYVRPLLFRGYNTLGVDGRGCPVEAVVASVPWGAYLGKEALEQGVDVQVSSWRRMAPDTLNALAKIGGQYVNSQNIVMEARDNGFAEGIALDINGYVSEGSGENIFVIVKGKIYTPPLSNSILGGITRDCAIKIAAELGYTVVEATLPREMLYMADEIFFTGTAAEITPVRSVDRIPVGDGKRGPITERIQARFFGIVEGELPDTYNWLTPIE